MHLPLPIDLIDTAARIRTWAAITPDILTVRLFGSRVKGTHRPDSDLDVAVGLAGRPSETTILMIDNKQKWLRQLELLSGFKVQLELADRRQDPTVWAGLRAGCVLIYRRPFAD
jgi:predicted nucleotidyltransferase